MLCILLLVLLLLRLRLLGRLSDAAAERVAGSLAEIIVVIVVSSAAGIGIASAAAISGITSFIES